jgi:hypothetical protein
MPRTNQIGMPANSANDGDVEPMPTMIVYIEPIVQVRGRDIHDIPVQEIGLIEILKE